MGSDDGCLSSVALRLRCPEIGAVWLAYWLAGERHVRVGVIIFASQLDASLLAEAIAATIAMWPTARIVAVEYGLDVPDLAAGLAVTPVAPMAPQAAVAAQSHIYRQIGFRECDGDLLLPIADFPPAADPLDADRFRGLTLSEYAAACLSGPS